jgi:hypothetical protein
MDVEVLKGEGKIMTIPKCCVKCDLICTDGSEKDCPEYQEWKKRLGRFEVIEPTEKDKEALKNKDYKLNSDNYPTFEIGEGIINDKAVQRLKWTIVEDERTAVEESIVEKIDVTYEILPNQREVNGKQNGYMVNRIANDYQYEDGILGCFDKDVGICCGIGTYSAIGLPPNARCNGELEYVKSLAEMDFRNLEKGIDNLFVDKFKRDSK